jgi:hypothetical protein
VRTGCGDAYQAAQAVGRGVAHAFNLDEPLYFEDRDLGKRAVAQYGSETIFQYFEWASITGPGKELPADWVALPSNEFAQRQHSWALPR